jgi:hypothetical protein
MRKPDAWAIDGDTGTQTRLALSTNRSEHMYSPTLYRILSSAFAVSYAPAHERLKHIEIHVSSPQSLRLV